MSWRFSRMKLHSSLIRLVTIEDELFLY